MQEILQNPTIVLFAILFLGLCLGNVSIKGIALGTSGVLFVAMVAGHYKLSVPAGVSELGTALFVYCVGLGVGNRFFASLRSRGRKLLVLALVIVLSGWLTAWGVCKLLGIDMSVCAGLFAGACTSTPALAAALEAARESGISESVINIGYGVAYPFGVIGVVLFVQLLPRMLRQSLSGSSAGASGDDASIAARMVHVVNQSVVGKNPVEVMEQFHMQCRITRILRGGNLLPLSVSDKLEVDDRVIMVGHPEQLEHDAALLGYLESADRRLLLPRDEMAEVILLDDSMSNHTIQQLDTLHNYGVVISRVTRLGNDFVPTQDTELLRNDVLRVVGSPATIAAFKKACGHRSASMNVADMLSLMGGLLLGVLLGKVTIGFGDGEGFSLGMAGGPLVVALILGHFGKLGPIVGYMPRPTRMLIMEFGLMLFLAGAGVKGGEKLVETLMANGLTMFLVGALITMLPLVIGYIFARKVLKMELAETLGCCCGAQTSTPALGAITAKTDNQDPVIAYSTAYPLALILMTVLSQLLIRLC